MNQKRNDRTIVESDVIERVSTCACALRQIGSEYLNRWISLTHCGRVTQICVFTLQMCRTGDADLRFNVTTVQDG